MCFCSTDCMRIAPRKPRLDSSSTPARVDSDPSCQTPGAVAAILALAPVCRSIHQVGPRVGAVFVTGITVWGALNKTTMPNPAHRPEISTHPRSIGGLPPFQLILDATIFRTPCMYHMASRTSAKFVPHRSLQPVHLRHSWDGRRFLAQGSELYSRPEFLIGSHRRSISITFFCSHAQGCGAVARQPGYPALHIWPLRSRQR